MYSCSNQCEARHSEIGHFGVARSRERTCAPKQGREASRCVLYSFLNGEFNCLVNYDETEVKITVKSENWTFEIDSKVCKLRRACGWKLSKTGEMSFGILEPRSWIANWTHHSSKSSKRSIFVETCGPEMANIIPKMVPTPCVQLFKSVWGSVWLVVVTSGHKKILSDFAPFLPPVSG